MRRSEIMVNAEEVAKVNAEAIIGNVNLMYQNNTARRYYLALLDGLKPELVKRGIRIIVDEV